MPQMRYFSYISQFFFKKAKKKTGRLATADAPFYLPPQNWPGRSRVKPYFHKTHFTMRAAAKPSP